MLLLSRRPLEAKFFPRLYLTPVANGVADLDVQLGLGPDDDATLPLDYHRRT